MLIYDEENWPLLRAYRNIPGLEACNVHKLNLLKLAPGGNLGRFIIWSSAAFRQLDNVFGNQEILSIEKKGWSLPRSICANADVSKLLDSDVL